MEATRQRARCIAGFMTIASFVNSLSMSWRVWYVGDSSGVAFLPMAAAITCLHSWLHYALAACDTDVAWISSCGLVLMGVNAIVHRTYSHDTWIGTYSLAAMFALTYFTSSMVTAAWLAKLALLWTLACNVAPVVRILTFPLPEIGVWTAITCALWAVYGALAGNKMLTVSNVIGVVVGCAEVATGSWTLPASFRPELLWWA
ncbi:hypothetical protein HPB50_023707 [Hyalomma asiaticum]|uniref:Uncharacterized protein n=1 Tax=Hyalomma asiaticum TaxID=266040 RepID=A0ACB7T6Y9_HYAAI|nr:hypothetical protein HPB50_023707 [Hyalomma asiaticum]